MAESANATADHVGKQIVYLNVRRAMSVNREASIDPVAKLPAAALHDLRERIESRDDHAVTVAVIAARDARSVPCRCPRAATASGRPG